jgi:hypothetical protein
VLGLPREPNTQHAMTWAQTQRARTDEQQEH